MTDSQSTSAAAPIQEPVPRLPSARRPLSPWVPILLISLALLTLVGGLTVVDFYWHDLRPDMGRIGANLAQVRDRQRAMLGHFAEAQTQLLEQQRQLLLKAQDLRRREQAVYEARLEIDAQRAQLALDLQAEAERRRIAFLRLTQAAKQSELAADELGPGNDLQGARTALALTESMLAPLPGPETAVAHKALASAQERLAAVRPVDRDALAKRLEMLRGQALGLRPVMARLLRDKANGTRRSRDPVAQAIQSLDSQFQAARQALDGADGVGFALAMQGIDRWLSAFYESRLPKTAEVLAKVRALAAMPVTANVLPLSEALRQLATTLRGLAAVPGDK
jgi:uncharacterized protein HemX